MAIGSIGVSFYFEREKQMCGRESVSRGSAWPLPFLGLYEGAATGTNNKNQILAAGLV